MAYKTLIAWTDHTFNPWMGCHKVSDGCKHCYAETLVKNRMGKGEMWGASGVRQRTKGPWRKVRGWNDEAAHERTPHRVFTASLADVFEDYPGPNEWRPDVWTLIRECPWLDFQILTKRPENIWRMLPDDWDTAFKGFDHYPNVWLGTSIEDERVMDRGEELTSNAAAVHFVSYEPALGPLDRMPLDHIEWLIVGGESGPGWRKMDLDWARSMRTRCAEQPAHDPTAFFFKQDSAPRTEMGIDALGEVDARVPGLLGSELALAPEDAAGMRWVLIEYERVDVRTVADHYERYVAGDIASARVVDADDRDVALSRADRPGFYSAFPLPTDLELIELMLARHQAQ